MATRTPTIQLTAATHFPIKLTSVNFPVWRKQVESTLTGLELEAFINGSHEPPKKFIEDKDGKKENLEYLSWYRQDQILISAILGSCSESIQLLISSASTAREAWVRLNSSYASASRSRVISLKSKLVKNPKGSRSITDYLQDMRSIADDLALAQSPISEEDLMVHILSQLGDEYGNIVAAIKVRETALSYPELFDKLLDFERGLKETIQASTSPLLTANYTSRQQGRQPSHGFSQRNQNFSPNVQQRGTNRPQWTNSQTGGNRQNPNRSTTYCHY